MGISHISYRIFFIAAIVVLIGCDKKNDNLPAKTEAQLIGSGTIWKFSKATAGGVDVSGFVDDCLKDNLITMFDASPTKNGVMNEGPSRCNPADPQQVDFTWTYDNSTKLLTIVSGGSVPILPGGSNVFTLVSVSETQMVLSQNVTIAPGSTQIVQATFIH
jgi:hypothetical protein